MKNSLLPTILIGTFLFAQSTKAQVRFGVMAGPNASNVKYQSGSAFDPLLGYEGGLMAEIGLSSKFFIRPALLSTTKGYSVTLELHNSVGTSTGTFRSTFRTNYVEFPLLLLYKAEVGKSRKVFGGLGPYMAAGINGKSNFEFIPTRQKQNIVFGPKNNRPDGVYNRMDYGLSAAVGLEMERVSLTVNYTHGLTRIGPSYRTLDPSAFYNRNLSLTAGYWFGI